MAEEVKIAFIIVTYNSGDYLEQCICSIKKRCYLKSYKIVVVDNMSTDKTCEIANNHEGVQLIINPENLGFGTANNIASKSIKADYYFLFNADAYFEGTFDFTRMLEVFENDSKIAILSARLEYPDGSSQTSSFTFSTPSKWFVQCIPFYNLIKSWIVSSDSLLRILAMFNEKINVYSSNHRSVVKDYGIADVEWVSGAAMVVSGEYISKHGLFDPNIFLYGEDEDLCIEAHARGYRVVLQNTDPVKHIHGWLGVNQYSVKVSQMKQRSLKYFIEKHFGRSASALLMRSLLPIYVNGWRNFLRNSISAYSKTY